MLRLLTTIVTIAGAASVALCGSYGWDQGGGVLRDQVTQAFIYGMVAVFTLALHVAGIRMWILGWRKLGALVVFAGFLAFVMTAFTSLGGLASRSDRFVAERQDVLDTKADTKGQIDALVKEKAGLKFTRTTQAGVDAAQRAVDAAKLAREQECGDGGRKVGENCRKRQDAEGAALAKLTLAQENKATTDRAIEIDGELKRLRSLKTDGTVGTANPLRDLLATIIGAWADVLTSWQKAAFVVIYDICLIATMIAIEVIGHSQNVSSKSTRSENVSPEPEIVDISPEPEPAPEQFAEPPAPLRAAGENELKVFMLACLLRAVGDETPGTAIYLRFQRWCSEQKPPLAAPDAWTFARQFKAVCDQAGIRTRKNGTKVLCLDVRLAA